MSQLVPLEGLPRLLTVRETAAALRVSDETIRRRLSDGTLDSVRLGGIIRVPLASLERALRPEIEQ